MGTAIPVQNPGGESDTATEKAVDLRQHESRLDEVYSDRPAMASFHCGQVSGCGFYHFHSLTMLIYILFFPRSNPLTNFDTWHKWP
jgi:hypothetical protein